MHPRSCFREQRELSFIPHGWVLMPDGRIFDPTRWTFEAKSPYLYVGPDRDEYDKGSNQLRAERETRN